MHAVLFEKCRALWWQLIRLSTFDNCSCSASAVNADILSCTMTGCGQKKKINSHLALT